MSTRRQFLLLAAALSGGTLLAGCGGGAPLSPWRGARGFAVEEVEGQVSLLALSAGADEWVRAESLDDFGVEPLATVGVVPPAASGDAAVILWANGDGVTRMAIVDASSESVEKSEYEVDSGARGLVSGSLFSILPGSAGNATAEVFALSEGAATRRVDLPFFPNVVGPAGRGLLLAGRENGAVVVSPVTERGEVGAARVLSVDGVPLDVCHVGGRDVVSVGPDAEGGRRGLFLYDDTGREAEVAGIGKPRLLCPAGGDRVAVDETDGADRAVVLLDVARGTETKRVVLPSTTPIRDLARAGTEDLVVVQDDRVTVLDRDLSTRSVHHSAGRMLSGR